MKERDLVELWVYLSSSPLLFLSLTLVVYLIAQRLFSASKQHPLVNPIALSTITLIIILSVTKTSYYDYFEGAQFIHFLLGPATVALAVPMYQQLHTIKRLLLPLIVTVVFGASFGAISSLVISQLFGASEAITLSLAPKSVTAPVAMSISEYIGGIRSLTAALVICTGIFGNMIGVTVFKWLRINSDSAKGLALGVTAHGIGTVKAFEISPQAGAFAGLGMAMSAMLTALILPWIVQFGFS